MANIPVVDGSNQVIYYKSSKQNNFNDPALSHETVAERIGDLTGGVPTTDTGSGSLNGRLAWIAQKITGLLNKLPGSLGQTTMNGSLSVAIAADQSPISASITSLPLPTNAATATAQASANTSLASIDSKLATLGTKTAAASIPVTIASDQPSQAVTMTPISLSNVTGDQTIVSPTTGKALRIYSLTVSNPTTLTSFVLKAGNTPISATLAAYDYGQEFNNPLGLAVNQAFVINLPATGSLNGYITWRQE